MSKQPLDLVPGQRGAAERRMLGIVGAEDEQRRDQGWRLLVP